MAALDPAPRKGFFANVGALILARGFLAAAQIFVLPVLARYLSIEEFAIMALAMSVVVFASVLSDAGLGRSLIRSEGFDPAEWSSVFWLLVGVGVVLGGAIVAIAPAWARFFDEPALVAILWVLALVPLMQAISAAPNAEIERREEYTALARLQVIAAVCGLVAAVGLAVAGAGVWALVAQQLLIAAVRLGGTLMISEFRPRLTFVGARLHGHIRFARDAVATSLISIAQTESATILVGKMLGAVPLGIFSMNLRFTRLAQFGIAGPMSSVVYVRMAKAQRDAERLMGIYLASSRILAAVLVPPLAMIAVAGPAIFTFLLSDAWAGVAPVFALSIPGLALEAATMTCLVCLFRAVGRTDLQVRLVTEGALLRIPLVALAALISVEAVALSLTLWAVLFIPRGWHLARQVVDLRMIDGLRAVRKPICVAAVAGAAQILAVRIADLGQMPQIALAMTLTCVSYAAVFALDRRHLASAIAVFR